MRSAEKGKPKKKSQTQAPQTKPKARQLIIETDGKIITVTKCELTALEVCETGRRLIRTFGGPDE